MIEKLVAKQAKTEQEIKDAGFVRNAVFVVEQKIDQTIQESGDSACDHFVAYLEGKPVGAGRIRYPEKSQAKIERMAVLKDQRGKKIGAAILETMLAYLDDRPVSTIILEAQYHAKGFYEKYGFVQTGEIFEEVGRPHIKMIKRLK